MDPMLEKYVLIKWPENIRIKYHPSALRVMSKSYRSNCEQYMVPEYIWEKYKNSYYQPELYNIISYTNKISSEDIKWDKFNKPTFYDEISVKIITQWIDNYKLLYQHQKKCPSKSEKPGLPKKSKLNMTSLLQRV